MMRIPRKQRAAQPFAGFTYVKIKKREKKQARLLLTYEVEFFHVVDTNLKPSLDTAVISSDNSSSCVVSTAEFFRKVKGMPGRTGPHSSGTHT